MRMACAAGGRSGRWIILSTIVLFLSCGGGGGDTSSPDLSSLSYSGLTTEAAIDSSNAVEIAAEAVNGGIGGTVFNGLASLSDSAGGESIRRYNALKAATIMHDAVVALMDGSPSAASGRAVRTERETVDGTCGGQATGLLQVDDATGRFSGSLTFSGYCDDDATLNGNAAFSGSIDLTTDTLEAIRLTFDDLSIAYADESYRFDGMVSITHHGGGLTVVMDMLLEDGTSGEVFWVDDYSMTVVDYPAYLSMTISGRFYAPRHGYVTVWTEQDLIIDDGDRMPTAGTLICSGKSGTAGGPTLARLTCYPSGEFQVEADTDGDGGFDWDSGLRYWDEQ